MDEQTIAAYDSSAKKISILHRQLRPSRLYQLIDQYFLDDGECADLGCGTGRDSSWMVDQGYRVTGIDASSGMLQQARNAYPEINFILDSLPLLQKIPDNHFSNLLCSAVIMHLPTSEIMRSITNIARIVRSDGIIIITFRGTQSEDNREDGKLYTPLTDSTIKSCFLRAKATLLHHEADREENRNLVWNNLVFRKLSHPEP